MRICVSSKCFIWLLIFFFFISPIHRWSPSAFSSVGGDGLSHSVFLLDGPCKDGAVNHLQASRLLRGDISCQWGTGTMTFGITHAFLLSVLRTVCYPLIKFILSSWKKPKGGTQMVVVIIEIVGCSEGATITTIQTIMELINSLVRLFI